MNGDKSPLGVALHSNGPASDHAGKMGLYAWLVGRWNLDVTIEQSDGTKHSTSGMVAAGWVLEGRAIQDVFAIPGMFYGTTLRVYDPSLDLWHVRWADPVNQVFLELTGQAQGEEIINEGIESPSLARLYGQSPTGRPATVRWIFSDVKADRFKWRSERSTDGKSWRLQRTYIGSRLETY